MAISEVLQWDMVCFQLFRILLKDTEYLVESLNISRKVGLSLEEEILFQGNFGFFSFWFLSWLKKLSFMEFALSSDQRLQQRLQSAIVELIVVMFFLNMMKMLWVLTCLVGLLIESCFTPVECDWLCIFPCYRRLFLLLQDISHWWSLSSHKKIMI